jgi:hypothetical protein
MTKTVPELIPRIRVVGNPVCLESVHVGSVDPGIPAPFRIVAAAKVTHLNYYNYLSDGAFHQTQTNSTPGTAGDTLVGGARQAIAQSRRCFLADAKPNEAGRLGSAVSFPRACQVTPVLYFISVHFHGFFL